MELIINGDQRLIDSSYSLMDLLVSLEMTQGQRRDHSKKYISTTTTQ